MDQGEIRFYNSLDYFRSRPWDLRAYNLFKSSGNIGGEQGGRAGSKRRGDCAIKPVITCELNAAGKFSELLKKNNTKPKTKLKQKSTCNSEFKSLLRMGIWGIYILAFIIHWLRNLRDAHPLLLLLWLWEKPPRQREAGIHEVVMGPPRHGKAWNLKAGHPRAQDIVRCRLSQHLVTDTVKRKVTDDFVWNGGTLTFLMSVYLVEGKTRNMPV